MKKFIQKLYSNHRPPATEFTRALNELIGFVPADLSVYYLAFEHRSVSQDVGANNERLEYLGDSALDLIIAEYLFENYPSQEEGFLTNMKSKMVSRAKLNEIAEKLGIIKLIHIHNTHIDFNHTSIPGNTLEAFIGAVYLEEGFEKTKSFVKEKIIIPHLDLKEIQLEETNYKSKLIEWCQKSHKQIHFTIIEDRHDNTEQVYKIGVKIDGKIKGEGIDYNKKGAEQIAAKEAYINLNKYK